jgi:hypothetical protein
MLQSKAEPAAVLNAEKLVKYYRVKNRSKLLEVDQIRDQLRLAVDRAMSEGSLYAPDLAALAIKQAEGDPLAERHPAKQCKRRRRYYIVYNFRKNYGMHVRQPLAVASGKESISPGV